MMIRFRAEARIRHRLYSPKQSRAATRVQSFFFLKKESDYKFVIINFFPVSKSYRPRPVFVWYMFVGGNTMKSSFVWRKRSEVCSGGLHEVQHTNVTGKRVFTGNYHPLSNRFGGVTFVEISGFYLLCVFDDKRKRKRTVDSNGLYKRRTDCALTTTKINITTSSATRKEETFAAKCRERTS